MILLCVILLAIIVGLVALLLYLMSELNEEYLEQTEYCKKLERENTSLKRRLNPADAYKHGKWITVEIQPWVCSKCKSVNTYSYYDRNFCTHCGQKVK